MTSTTYKEILETQPSLEKTRERIDADYEGICAFFEGSGHDSLVFLGCGSSFSLSKSLAAAANFILEKPAYALAGGDVYLHVGKYAKMCKNALVVLVSRSGETSELRLAIEALREQGANVKVFSINCTENSTLAKLSDYSLNLPWAYDYSVCQTRSVSCLYFAGAYILSRLAGRRELEEGLLRAAADTARFMAKWEETVAGVAKTPFTSGVVLGDAELAGICDEGALTFKEICQLPSNFYNLLDARHGPMVLFGADTIVLVALSDAENEYERAFVEDVLSRGCRVVAYSDNEFDIPGVTCIYSGGKLPHMAKGLPFIAICQLLTCYKAVEIGVDPDKPQGLAPCITL